MSVEPLPERQRWATAIGRPLDEIASLATPLLRRGEPIAVVGGALAAALIQPLRDAGFEIVAAETRHPLLDGIPDEAAEYEAFGNGYGEIHSVRAFRQLVERAARTFTPKEDRWYEDGRVVDPFRPNLRYGAASDHEFDVLAERHLNTVRSAFRRARVVLVALSSSEIWEAVTDGAVFPHWADVGERHFDVEAHRARMLTVEESVADLEAAATVLRELNPGVEVVLMISPEPQPATALPIHVLAAATLGKAVLRIAAETATRTGGVHYFPALEIASLHAADPGGAVPPAVVGAVAEALVQVSEGGRANHDGTAAPIAVLQSGPAQVQPAAQATDPAPAERTALERSAGVRAATVDAYSEAAAAEQAEKKAARTAKRAARALTGDAAASKHAQKVAEREARQKAKADAKVAERAATAAASAEEAQAAAARKQKLAERKARFAAIAAARDAKRTSRASAQAPADAAGDAQQDGPPRRRRSGAVTAPVTAEVAPAKARRTGRAKDAAAPADQPGSSEPSKPARAGPKRAGRARQPRG
jgi:hypothetical protein